MNIHVFIGSDDFLVYEAAKKIVGDGTGLEVVDSANSVNEDLRLADLKQVKESVFTPPFLDPRKVTWWKRVHFLPGGGKDGDQEKVSEAVKSALDKFVDQLVDLKMPDNHHFVITAPHLLRTSKIAKKLMTAAEVVYFGGGSEERQALITSERIRKTCGELGIAFAPEAESKFMDRVGHDTYSIINELCKLRDYLGKEKRPVTAEDVDEVTSIGVGVEPMPWDVTDAIGARDAKGAMDALRRFELQRGFEVFMSAMVEKLFRQLYDLKVALAEKRSVSLGLAPYQLRKLVGFSQNWSLHELRVARYRFLNLREKFVSGETESGPIVVVTEILRTLHRREVRR